MGIEIAYHPLVVKADIPSLGNAEKKRVRAAIESRLSVAPDIYGSPLRATLKGYWKMRVGDWRIVYLIKRSRVFIVFIGHRSEVYGKAERRIS